MLSYRSEIALQGALVFAKSRRLELGDFREKKTQNKRHYGVQGHSRSSRSVPIESPYAISH